MDILERIRKILSRTTENGCTEGEAQAAAHLAARLMEENNISIADLEMSEFYQDEQRMNRWTYENDLAFNIVDKFFPVECVLQPSGRAYIKQIFGTRENVERAQFTYRKLLEAFRTHWNTHQLRTNTPTEHRRAYIVGFSAGYSAQLMKEKESQPLDNATALSNNSIVVRTIAQKTASAFEENNAGREITRKDNSITLGDLNQEVVRAGFADGYKLFIGREIGREQRNQLQ